MFTLINHLPRWPTHNNIPFPWQTRTKDFTSDLEKCLIVDPQDNNLDSMADA